MRVKTFTIIGAALLVAMVMAASGSAKWVIGNGSTDLEVTEPNPAVPGQVCTTHIEGRAGLGTSADPAVTPPPSPPYSALVVELFTGPGGSLDGYQGGPTGQLVPPDPSLPPVPAVASVTTAAPTALNPPEQYTANGVDRWEYAAAPFSFDLPAGTIADGNEVALRLGSHTAIVTRSATTCAAPQPLAASIDVLPGISPNLVIPSLKAPVLPVRVFGSAQLDVTAIATVKLGTAGPATLPPSLARLLTPRDRNHDGYLDRDYVFVPKATGISCGATSVDLTGTLTNGTPFAGTDAIRTVLC